MSLVRTMMFVAVLLLLAIGALAQDPNVKNYARDGLSFDYPATWQLSDQSTKQMQFLELAQGDVVIRIRSPREWLKTPEKEAHAKKLFQDQYVDEFVAQVEQAGMHPKRSPVTTQIAGADAPGMSVRAVMDGQPGGMDSYSRIVSDRLVNVSTIGSEKDFAKSAIAWNMIRNSLKVEAAPQPKATPQPSPTKKKP
ncbi:MAG: hypothetical protein QOH71_3166 [Blastocatellia bacterium]|nr:hypothetical protein [Blastocatellia bacterium]